MADDTRLGIVMATYLEAKPFVKGWELRRTEKSPFRLYERDHIALILSGVGKANAAMATAYLIWKHDARCILNAGAAGAMGKMEVGDIFHIKRVIEYDRPAIPFGRKRVVVPALLPGFATATLATQDRAVLDAVRRERMSLIADLADMEGASVVQACKRFGARCYLFKVVTDTVEDSGTVDIVINIKRTRKKLFEFVDERVYPLLSDMDGEEIGAGN
jgi:adenosylhomocysteine nucleosidase